MFEYLLNNYITGPRSSFLEGIVNLERSGCFIRLPEVLLFYNSLARQVLYLLYLIWADCFEYVFFCVPVTS